MYADGDFIMKIGDKIKCAPTTEIPIKVPTKIVGDALILEWNGGLALPNEKPWPLVIHALRKCSLKTEHRVRLFLERMNWSWTLQKVIR